jgi:hypothetical protein
VKVENSDKTMVGKMEHMMASFRAAMMVGQWADERAVSKAVSLVPLEIVVRKDILKACRMVAVLDERLV